MTATREELIAIAEKNGTDLQAHTDLDIFSDGELLDSLKDVGPEGAFPSMMTAVIMADMGFKMELRFSNAGVFEMAQAAPGSRENLTVSLRDA